MSARCAACGHDVDALLATLPGGRVGRQDSCPQCRADLRSCVNCDFYDTNRKWECREDVQERVGDKEKANFCDFFKFKAQSQNAQPKPNKNDLLGAAEALFKKK